MESWAVGRGVCKEPPGDGKIPFGVWSRKRVQSPTMLSCKQGAVGRGHSSEGPSVGTVKGWLVGRDAQRC